MASLTSRVRVLVVDDETLMRAGLRLMIDGSQGIEVVAEAGDGAQALALVAQHDPDVVLMDVRMPVMDGLEATRRLIEDGARSQVVVLTAFDTDDHLLRALRAGACSFLLKDSPPEHVVDAVLSAARGEARFSSSSLRRLVTMATQDDAQSASSSPTGSGDGDDRRPRAMAPEGVTEREWEVAHLVAQGLTNAEIAARLFLSLPTVKTHTSHLFDKFAVTNRVQLALRVIEAGG